MSTAVSSLPTSGTFPVNVSSLVSADTEGRKRKDGEEVVAMRYAFKPASIIQSTPGVLISDATMGKSVTFDVSSGNRQVFEIKEESSKPRDCVLIWDDNAQIFKLYPLSTTLNLTLNRSASTSSRRMTTVTPSKPLSPVSSSSSSPVPLSKRKQAEPDGIESHSSGEHRLEVSSSTIGETDKTPKAKKVKSSEVISPDPRQTRGGKSAPRNASMSAQVSNLKAKIAGRKGTTVTKAPTTPKGKYKSAEIIEDSDEDYGLNEDAEGEEDEFAKMVGESLAVDEGDGDEGEGDEEDDDEEEDEGDELGGATLVVRDEGSAGQGMIDGDSEWL